MFIVSHDSTPTAFSVAWLGILQALSDYHVVCRDDLVPLTDYSFSNGCEDNLAHLQTAASTVVVKMTWHTIQTVASAMVVCRNDFGTPE